MKGFKVVLALCGAVLLMAGCAVPMGDNLLIDRGGNGIVTYTTDYNLQTYIPIPKTGEAPVSSVNRGDLDVSVTWKDSAGIALSSLPVFQANTVYKAEIKLIPRTGYGFNPSIPFAYHPGKISAQVDDLGDPTRTVTVTYNNSNDADITFITDYNLQRYVPIPIDKEMPVWAVTTREDLAITAAWEKEDSPGSDTFTPIGTADSFGYEAVYRAAIELTTKPGYRFSDAKNFTYTDGAQTSPAGSESDPGIRRLTAVYSATRAPRRISDCNLTNYVAKPVSGATPLGSFSASQYTGIVSWKNTLTQAVLAGPFAYGTAYTAELVLTPASGYIIDGIQPGDFIHTGAETITNLADSGVVTISFPATASVPSPMVVYDTILTSRIPKPVSRTTPVTSFTGSQYNGTVVWKNTDTQTILNGLFQTNTSYTAVISLTALPGYTFTGLEQNVFTHTGAETVINPRDSGTVTIKFPRAGAFTLQAVSFGPVVMADSALKLMKERKDDNNPVVIELSGGAEELVAPDTAELLANYNSPAIITINGNGRVLKIEEPGTLITVKNGITLTLTNLTLRGMAVNNKPLVKVESGGKLILGNGAVLTGNETTHMAGGVWISGGELVMNSGAAIRNSSGTRTPEYPFPANQIGSGGVGGVYVGDSGRFTMNDGTVEYCSVDGADGAGGVYVAGVFNMYGGTIQYNIGDEYGGVGGVYIGGHDFVGIFNMYGGAIQFNTTYGDGFPTNGVPGINKYGGVIENNTVLPALPPPD